MCLHLPSGVSTFLFNQRFDLLFDLIHCSVYTTLHISLYLTAENHSVDDDASLLTKVSHFFDCHFLVHVE